MAQLKKLINKRLGEMLEDAGFLSSEDIASALKIQKDFGGKFGEVVVREGYCTEENIIRALVNQLNAPFLDVSCCKLNEELIRKVPYGLAVASGLLPLDQMNDMVLIAITSPISSDVYNELETVLGGSLHLCVADMNQINARIEEIYTPEDKKQSAKSEADYKKGGVSANDHLSDATDETEPKADTEKEASTEEDDGMTGLGNLLLGE
ncbi:MAG: hypothetical protein COA79_03180 [Planctomycetota bacterium]|nr:MAG: hypothetical protein COA79_03180 [Planctomycetota bacterium]